MHALAAQPGNRRAAPHRAIGSVLPMPPVAAGAPRADSLWASWRGGHRHVAAYGNARSALAALLEFRGIERVWLPAYCCPAVAQAAAVCQTLWYGVDATLSPVLADLAGLRRGDAVVAIAYFGRSPNRGLTTFATTRPDVLWIEDRAQALAPEGPDWADATLYSPRKLIGVGDGGLLVANAALPHPAGPYADHPAAAQIARAADPAGCEPERWFPSFRAQEAAFGVDDAPMDHRTEQVLHRVPAAALAAQRRANARLLATHLSGLSLWRDTKWDFAPLAFPIQVPDAAGLAGRMADDAIYCARHWTDLPSPPDRFPVAHRLSDRLLSLPCDHRYGAADMLRIVEALRHHTKHPAPG